LQLKAALTGARPAPPQAAPRTQVIQRVLKVGADKFKTGSALRHWKGYKNLAARVKKNNHNHVSILNLFQDWAMSDDRYDFRDWDDATFEARRSLRATQKKKRKHSVERDTSPMRETEQDLYDLVKVHVDSYTEKHKKQKDVMKRLPTETNINGLLGECAHQYMLQQSGVEFKNANSIAMNIPGIDMLVNDPSKFFGQSKCHLESEDPNIYLGHRRHVDTASKKLVKSLIADTPAGKKRRLGHEELLGMVRELKESVGEGLTPDDLYSEGDDTGIVNRISNATVFPVPKNIYPSLPRRQKPFFVELPFTTRDIKKVKSQFEFRMVTERGPRKTSDEKDGDYKPN
jgi:hypothetical protein